MPGRDPPGRMSVPKSTWRRDASVCVEALALGGVERIEHGSGHVGRNADKKGVPGPCVHDARVVRG